MHSMAGQNRPSNSDIKPLGSESGFGKAEKTEVLLMSGIYVTIGLDYPPFTPLTHSCTYFAGSDDFVYLVKQHITCQGRGVWEPSGLIHNPQVQLLKFLVSFLLQLAFCVPAFQNAGQWGDVHCLQPIQERRVNSGKGLRIGIQRTLDICHIVGGQHSFDAVGKLECRCV